jgi:hypothetical protein
MICLLRRARRCFAVKGAGAGVLMAWCIAGGVLGLKASGLVGCLANEIPFMTPVRCSEERLWIRSIAACFDTVALANPNLINRPCGVLSDQRFRIGGDAFEHGQV